MDFIDDSNIEADVFSRTCSIRNFLHKTDSGCKLVEEDTGLVHYFKKILPDYDKDGKLLFDTICLKDREKYIVKSHRNGNVSFGLPIDGLRVTTIYDKIVENSFSFKSTLAGILSMYFSEVKPNLFEKQHMSIPSLFDGVVSSSEERPILHFLRPINIVDSHMFTRQLRNAFFQLIEGAINNKSEGDFDVGELKDAKTCDINHFRSSTFPEFKCSYGNRSACAHIRENMVNGKLAERAPKELCNFLIAEYIEQFDSGPASRILGFTCLFGKVNDCIEKDDIHPMNVFVNLYGRKNPHRMCIPARYLNKTWLEWFIKDVLQIKIDARNEIY